MSASLSVTPPQLRSSYVLTGHARSKMEVLGVTVADVEAVLSGRHATRRSKRYAGANMVSGTIRGRRILLAFSRGTRPLRVISVMLSR